MMGRMPSEGAATWAEAVRSHYGEGDVAKAADYIAAMSSNGIYGRGLRGVKKVFRIPSYRAMDAWSQLRHDRWLLDLGHAAPGRPAELALTIPCALGLSIEHL